MVTGFEKCGAISEPDISQGGQRVPIECLEYYLGFVVSEVKASYSNEREWCLLEQLFHKIAKQDSHLVILRGVLVEPANCQGSQLRLGDLFSQLVEHKAQVITIA